MAISDNQGLLAFGDSITNGGGELQWGVALQSWAQWVSRGLGLPFTNYAVDGARAADVVKLQIPAHARLNAVAEPRYQLGCLYIGVNDVRDPGFELARFEHDFAAALERLGALCERMLTMTIPLELGRPRVGAAVVSANAAIRRQAQDHGALLVSLENFGGRELMMFDHVHPTAMGQIAIAERVLDQLAATGLVAAARPSTMVAANDCRRARARAWLTYGYRSGKQELRLRLGTR